LRNNGGKLGLTWRKKIGSNCIKIKLLRNMGRRKRNSIRERFWVLSGHDVSPITNTVNGNNPIYGR
jgi:hypothetical protein